MSKMNGLGCPGKAMASGFVPSAFWSAPLTGIDSKGGTLVHECSHFTVVASTDDWAYGTAGCQGLSTAKKIDNADCHEYFAETK